MPMYTYKCRDCSKEETFIFSVDERKQSIGCDCGGQFFRQISAPGRVWAPTRRSQ